eukprot:PhF_6_TR6901/c0_g1_i2/m.10017
MISNWTVTIQDCWFSGLRFSSANSVPTTNVFDTSLLNNFVTLRLVNVKLNNCALTCFQAEGIYITDMKNVVIEGSGSDSPVRVNPFGMSAQNPLVVFLSCWNITMDTVDMKLSNSGCLRIHSAGNVVMINSKSIYCQSFNTTANAMTRASGGTAIPGPTFFVWYVKTITVSNS